VFSLSRKLKLNLNSRIVVIFVLRLVKPLSEAKVTQWHSSTCIAVCTMLANWIDLIGIFTVANYL